MTAVRVEAPARLHMGMLDPSGEGARRFGGLGVAVCRPAVFSTRTSSRASSARISSAGRRRAREARIEASSTA